MKAKIAYLVSSHFSYCTFAVPPLLQSMKESGVPASSIFVIVCGCVREFDVKTIMGNFWYVNHESRNFCTFVEAINPKREESLKDFSHVFCLLDTCKAGPRFAELTSDIDIELDAVGANPFCGFHKTQSDLGAYKIDYLKKRGSIISMFKNAPPIVNFDYEGKMYEYAPTENRCFYGGIGGNQHYADAADVYGTGTLRLTEYYTAIDLYKYKSNWGQNGKNLLDRL